MRRTSQKGFTLLEVLMATSLLAVGSVSIIVVLTTAAGFASNRIRDQRITQVFEEARFDAQGAVNRFNPSGKSDTPAGPDAENGTTKPVRSSLFAGYDYVLRYIPIDRNQPGRGFQVDMTVRYGDDQERFDTAYVVPDMIPESEFRHSITYDAERAGTDSEQGGKGGK